jgi:hypothetical protein
MSHRGGSIEGGGDAIAISRGWDDVFGKKPPARLRAFRAYRVRLNSGLFGSNFGTVEALE